MGDRWEQLFALTPETLMLTRSYIQQGNHFPATMVNTLLLDNTEEIVGFEIDRGEFVDFIVNTDSYQTLRELLPEFLDDGKNLMLTQDAVLTLIELAAIHFGDEDQVGGTITFKIGKIFGSQPSYAKALKKLIPISPEMMQYIEQLEQREQREQLEQRGQGKLTPEQIITPDTIKRIIYDDLFGKDKIRPLQDGVGDALDDDPDFNQLIRTLIAALDWLGMKAKPPRILKTVVKDLYRKVADKAMKNFMYI